MELLKPQWVIKYTRRVGRNLNMWKIIMLRKFPAEGTLKLFGIDQ